MPRFDAGWIEAMIGAERTAATPPEQLLDLVAVDNGDTVADVGCGPGFLTLPAARRVGETGRVWALDAEPKMTRLVEQRAAEAGLGPIVRPLLVTGAQLPLADASAAVVLCSLLLHFFKEPGHDLDALPAFARELRRIAAAKARLLIVEWQPGADSARSNRLTADECALALQRGDWKTGPPIALGSVVRPSGPEAMYAMVCRPRDADVA